MCGIVIYRGNEKIALKNVLELANGNIHRGNDGVGIMYLHNGNLKVYKTLKGIDEVYSGILSKTDDIVRRKIGSFESR